MTYVVLKEKSKFEEKSMSFYTVTFKAICVADLNFHLQDNYCRALQTQFESYTKAYRNHASFHSYLRTVHNCCWC